MFYNNTNIGRWLMLFQMSYLFWLISVKSTFYFATLLLIFTQTYDMLFDFIVSFDLHGTPNLTLSLCFKAWTRCCQSFSYFFYYQNLWLWFHASDFIERFTLLVGQVSNIWKSAKNELHFMLPINSERWGSGKLSDINIPGRCKNKWDR